MRIGYRILVIIFLFVCTNSSAQSFEWAQKAGWYAFDLGYGISTDYSGNVYIAGKYEMTAIFGGTKVTCAGNHDIYIAKYSPTGVFQWVRTAGGTGGDYARAIAVDSAGNSYVTGEIESTAKFGSVSLTSLGSNDVFVVKYNTNGDLQWAKNLGGGIGSDRGLGISESKGNIYVTGTFQGKAYFPSNTFLSSGGIDIFIAKYNSVGDFLWIQKAGGTGNDESYAISNDPAGNAYITGFFSGTANFSGTSLISYGANDIFIAKYNPAGGLLWVKKAGGTGSDYGMGIKVDNSFNVFLTGGFRLTSTFGSISIKGLNGDSDIFIARYTSSGEAVWVKKAGGVINDYGRAIALDAKSNCYITGNFGLDATFGTTTITGMDSTEIYFASYDVSGNFRWVMQAGGEIDVQDPGRFIEMGLSIATDRAENVFASGAYRSISTFGGTSLTTWGDHTEVYITKIKAPSNLPIDSLNHLADFRCSGSGTITRDHWTNVGTSIFNAPFNSAPSSTSQLTIFEGPSNTADNYGSRIRGYICPPITGKYTFWIASDNNSELWLSTNGLPANKVKIASVTGFTQPRVWTKYPSQQSIPITLTAGIKYYIEAIHRESIQGDNLAVGWQLPDSTYERPIPGTRLSPFTIPLTSSITSPVNNSLFNEGSAIPIQANVTGEPGTIQNVEFFAGTTKLGEDATSPYSFIWNNAGQGAYEVTVKVTASGNATAVSSKVNVYISPVEGTCNATGTILREVWNNISGSTVSAIPFSTAPNVTEQLSIFRSPPNAGDNYGQRIRGYVCPPVTGNYIFWIASDDDSELWLSTNDNPANKQKIASVTGYTSSSQWTKYPSQQSIAINLTAGMKYYIEALHKEGSQGDNCAVGWQLPNGILERPIPGTRLSPFANPLTVSINSPINNSAFNIGTAINIQALASGGLGTIKKVEFFADTTSLGEDLTSPYNVNWNNAAIGSYALTAKVTDNGNNSAVSSIINISVNAPDHLITAITSPLNNTSFNAGSPLSIQATASGGTGTIQKVEFFAGATNLGESITSPYSFTWNNAAPGNYALTSKVTDSVNNTSVSAIINITVVNLPIVTISSPVNLTSYPSPANITVNATATYGAGSIAKVEFYQGSTKIGESLTAPYSFTWMNVTAGNYTLKAIATDNLGQTGASQEVNIVVTTCSTPVITPSGPTTMCSGSLTLQANTGSGYMYQWKKDGVNITGATNSFLLVTISGTYQVKIIQGSCISWSAPTAVKIQSGLYATITQGGPTTFCAGGNVKLFGSTCTGNTYIWKKNGSAITGATAGTYTATTAGSYQLQVTRSGVNAWSSLVTVTVNVCRELETISNEENNQDQLTDSVKTFQMKVYPNPNTGLFTIELNMPFINEEKVKFRIVNILGQQVYDKGLEAKDQNIKEVVELDKSLPPGGYILQVTIGNKMENTNMILVR